MAIGWLQVSACHDSDTVPMLVDMNRTIVIADKTAAHPGRYGWSGKVFQDGQEGPCFIVCGTRKEVIAEAHRAYPGCTILTEKQFAALDRPRGQYQIEQGSQNGKLRFVVTQRPIGRPFILTYCKTKAEAEAWIAAQG